MDKEVVVHIFNGILLSHKKEWASLVALLVRICLPWGRRVFNPYWEYPLEEGTAIHSSILAWRIPWAGGPDGLPSMKSQRVKHTTERLRTYTHRHFRNCSPPLFFNSKSTRNALPFLFLCILSPSTPNMREDRED